MSVVQRFRSMLIPVAIVMMLLASCMPFQAARSREIDRIRMKSRQYMIAGDYKNALAVYDVACPKYFREKRFSSSYRQAKAYIHRAADEAYGKEDFALSGSAYAVLVNDSSYCRRRFQEPPLERIFLTRMEESSTQLSQRALARYREGDLAQAISIWRGILAFDPNNVGIRKAVDKATIQLKTLGKIK